MNVIHRVNLVDVNIQVEVSILHCLSDSTSQLIELTIASPNAIKTLIISPEDVMCSDDYVCDSSTCCFTQLKCTVERILQSDFDLIMKATISEFTSVLLFNPTKLCDRYFINRFENKLWITSSATNKSLTVIIPDDDDECDYCVHIMDKLDMIK